MPIPTDLLVFNELRLIGSFGRPIASYSGMFSMVAAGKLHPIRLVETVGSVADAGRLLHTMTDFNTLGFAIINEWPAAA
jgi:alcohol dehydrogenase